MKSKQPLDPLLMEFKEYVRGKVNESFSQRGMVFLGIKVDCVPNVDDLRNRFLKKAHGARFSIHLCATKMYHDLREVF